MTFGANIKFKHHGGPLQYFGNRNLTLPDSNGIMKVDLSWMEDSFSILLSNQNQTKFDRCFEPFAGSAAWSLNAMEIGFSKEYFLNDSNKALVDFFLMVKREPKRIKDVYSNLVNRYLASKDQELEFISIINEYNKGDDVTKSLLISFVVNYSWGGMLFYDEKGLIIYRRQHINEHEVPGCIINPTLSVHHYCEEVDRISTLLNVNKVHFQCSDFEKAIPLDLNSQDFLILNPPYPENERSHDKKCGLYFELYSHHLMHEKLSQLIDKCEHNDITYFMSYGLYNPALIQFRIRDTSDESNYYLRIIGSESCAFGKLLDQVYFNKKCIIPNHLQSKLISAKEIVKDESLSHRDALEVFIKRAQEKNSFISI